MRRWLLRNPWIKPMCIFNYAAIKIQQLVRGFIVRKYGLQNILIKRNNNNNNKYKYNKNNNNKNKNNNKSNNNNKNKQLDKYLSFIEIVQASEAKKPLWLDGGYSSWCTVRIQSVWRMFKVKRRVRNSKRLINQVASIVIQTAWRNHRELQLQRRRAVALSPHLAAHVIQLKWRSFCNKRVFRYFRDLVLVKLRGAPADLLRMIIPNETGYLDKASGVHVRFRLGGSIFPPKIFFKIFTHKPVCDVNSFAPRDYKSEKEAVDPFQTNTKLGNINFKSKKVDVNRIKVGTKYFDTVVSVPYGATENWYRREEQNPWRSISSQIFENIETPPWYRDTPHVSKPKPFHFNRQKRQEELLKEKKRKKRQWMMKAYLMASDNNNNNDNQSSEREDKHENHPMNITMPSLDPQPRQYDLDQKYSDQLDFFQSDSKNNNNNNNSTVRLDPNISVMDNIQKETGYMYNKNSTLLSSKPFHNNNNNKSDYKNNKIMEDEFSLPSDDMLDLVDWSSALNFEDYSRDWALMGTSLPSDFSADMLNRNKNNNSDEKLSHKDSNSYQKDYYYGSIQP